MTWTTPPAHLTAVRDHLVQLPSFAAFGLVSARFHYPSAQPTDDAGGTPDTLPYAVLADEQATVTPFAEPGVRGLRTGSVTCTVYAASTANVLEKLAADASAELAGYIGLVNPSMAYDRASEPSGGSRAEGTAICTITLTISFGVR